MGCQEVEDGEQFSQIVAEIDEINYVAFLRLLVQLDPSWGRVLLGVFGLSRSFALPSLGPNAEIFLIYFIVPALTTKPNT